MIVRDWDVVGDGILPRGSIWRGTSARYAKLSLVVCVDMATEEGKVVVPCLPSSYGSVRRQPLCRYHLRW